MALDLPPDVPALIRQCAPHVAVQTLRPLIHVESARRPHAIGYKVVASNGEVYRLTAQPKNLAEAQKWATWIFPAILPGGVIDSKPLMKAGSNKTTTKYEAMKEQLLQEAKTHQSEWSDAENGALN